jgi:predicted solute-binding protein
MKHQLLITLNSHPAKQDIFIFKTMENGKKNNVHETNSVINEIMF